MEIITKSPFQIIPFAGQINFPKHSLTLLVKATFDISHKDLAKVSGDQIPASADEFYPEDKSESGTLYYPSDFAFFKPAADVILSAKCHVPNEIPIPACPVSIKVGEFEKNLVVHGSRHWKNIYLSPKTTEPKPFTEMDLIYERSFGGADYALNPIGRGILKKDITVADNVLPVPNIQDPNNPASTPFVKTSPAGFSALHSHWSQRHKKLGTYNKKYLKTRWPWFPDDFDWSHFNAAPRDQQIENYLRGDEKLVFENLHKKFPHYETQLPCIRPRCFTRKLNPKTGKRYFDEVKLKLDTLWVDMEKEKLVLSWRGWTDVQDADFEEVKQIFLMEESMYNSRASIETCYEEFKQTQAAEDAEFEAKPKIPKAVPTKVKKPVKLPSGSIPAAAVISPALSAEELLDKEVILSQVDKMMEDAGITLTDLPPETQEKIQTAQSKLFASPAENIADNESHINDIMQNLGIDINNPPSLSPKAKQEQSRFIEALGFDSAGTEITPELDKTWAVLGAFLPKMGMSLENLSPLLTQSEEQIKLIKKQLNPRVTKPEEPTPAKPSNAANTQVAKTDFTRGQSYQGQDLQAEDFSGMNLSGCDFSYCILTNANFSNCNLEKANFQHANLSKANFEQANLMSSDFSYADAQAANMTKANCDNCIIDNANFEKIQADFSHWKLVKGKDAVFVRSSLKNTTFIKSDLENADFEAAALDEADFSQSQLINATFENVVAKKSVFFQANITGLRASQSANFSQANFSQCSGESPIFLNANFEDADLSYADLTGANFDRAHLKMANLCAANLKQTRFIKANLSNCQLVKTNLMQSSVERANLFQADLRGANCYEVEFLDAQLEEANFENTNLAGSKLA